MRIAAGARLNVLTGEVNSAASGEGETEAKSPALMLNERERAEVDLLEAFFKMGGWLSVHPDGPLWFRGYGKWTEEKGTPIIAELLKGYEADHFVVGHTITADRDIVQRFGGTVFLVDTVQPSALEIQDGRFTAIYPEGRERPKPAGLVTTQETMAPGR
jgi:hypothetical protein